MVWIHLYKIPEATNKSIEQNQKVVAWEYKKLGSDGYLRYGDGFTDMCMDSKTFQIVHINLSMYNLLYVNYPTIKLFKTIFGTNYLDTRILWLRKVKINRYFRW